MRRIVHVNGVASFLGGAETFLHLLARQQMLQGDQVQLVALGQSNASLLWEELPVVKHGVGERYWPAQRTASRLSKILWHARDLVGTAAAKAVAQLVSNFDPDIVHVHNVAGFGAAVFGAIKHIVPSSRLVWTAHDYWVGCVRSTLLDRKGAVCEELHPFCRAKLAVVRRQIGTNIDVVVAPSRFMANRLMEWGVASENEIRVIRNAVTTGWLSPQADDDSARANGEIRFLFLGQLETHKGVATLLEAARLAGTATTHLSIAGRGELESWVQEEWPDGYMGFLSGDERLEAFRHNDVLVIPSEWHDNCPLVILEAMARGMAIIGTRMGGIPEIISDGETGLLVPAGSPAALAEAMSRCRDNPRETRAMGKRARAVAARYSIIEICEQYDGAYCS